MIFNILQHKSFFEAAKIDICKYADLTGSAKISNQENSYLYSILLRKCREKCDILYIDSVFPRKLWSWCFIHFVGTKGYMYYEGTPWPPLHEVNLFPKVYNKQPSSVML